MADSGKQAQQTLTTNWIDEDGTEFDIFDVCRSRDIKYLRQYLDEDGDPDLIMEPHGTSLLRITCCAFAPSQTAHTKLLLERGADPNKGTPLYDACYLGKLDSVRHLVNHCARVNEGTRIGATPLHGAVRAENPDIVSFLLQNGADPDITGDTDEETPLYVAVDLMVNEDAVCFSVSDLMECARLLLEKGANSCIQDLHGNTPLGRACEKGNVDCVSHLLRHGADANVAWLDGRSLLFVTAAEEHFECFQELLEHGAIPDALDECGDALLSHLCVRSMFSYARLLLSHGANVNIVNKTTGRTPLYICCGYGKPESVRFLMENGADPLIPSKKGRTPFMKATRKGHESCVDVLKEFGVVE